MTGDHEYSANCSRCGEVTITVDRLWLVITNVPGRMHFDFWCPSCAGLERRAVDDNTAYVLASLIAVEELTVPAEALESHPASQMTLDDLIDLRLALDAWDENGVGPEPMSAQTRRRVAQHRGARCTTC